MIRGLYIASTGMITKQIQQENLTNNIANINTPGFKSDKISFKSFNDVLIENYDRKIGNKNFKNSIGTMSVGVSINKTNTDFSQGILEDTNRNLDFAIEGNCFFTVSDGKNEYYTRNGRFKIDSEGYLSTLDGKRIIGLNENNQKTYIKVDSNNFNFDENIIKSNGTSYKFLLVNGNMEKLNENLLYGENIQQSTNGIVHQGKIEKANVDAIELVTELITVMRNFESNQKVIQSMDETLGKTVNGIGSINR